MAGKKTKNKKSAGFEAFNKSQQIYKLLEKGIIESEALSSNGTDRPEQEDHIAALLGSPEPKPYVPIENRQVSVKRKSVKPKKQKASAKLPRKPKKLQKKPQKR